MNIDLNETYGATTTKLKEPCGNCDTCKCADKPTNEQREPCMGCKTLCEDCK